MRIHGAVSAFAFNWDQVRHAVRADCSINRARYHPITAVYVFTVPISVVFVTVVKSAVSAVLMSIVAIGFSGGCSRRAVTIMVVVVAVLVLVVAIIV